MLRNFLYIFLLVFVFAKCKKDPPKPTPVVISPSSVYIVNEGNFGWGNGEISLYNPDTKSVDNTIFYRNNSYKLGDVVQSISEHNGKYYIVVNNSGKIEIVNKTDFKHISTITGFKSPRFFMPVNATTAYVTDLYDNQIAVVDLATNTIIKHISIVGWTEEMLLYNDVAYVSNIHSDHIYKVDTKTHTLTDSTKVLYGSNSMVRDKTGAIWVACLGDSLKGYKGGIACLAANGKDVLKTLPFATAKEFASDLRLNPTGDTLYYINKHIYALPISATALPATLIFDGSGKILYGLGVDPKTSTVYAADAKDYVSDGMIYMISPQTKIALDSFKTGIIPNGFLFK